MTAVELLREDSEVRRLYRTESDYCDYFTRLKDAYEAVYPETNWNDCWEMLSQPSKAGYEVAVKHMVKWGKSDASLMEKHWGVKLPSWIHDFYSEVVEAVLGWRNLYTVLAVPEIIRNEEEYRRLQGNENEPIRLIRFAEVWGQGDFFAFRQRVCDDQWEVFYAAHYESTAYYQEAEWDGEGIAENLDEWMERLVRTDGYPSIEDNEEYEEIYMHRVG